MYDLLLLLLVVTSMIIWSIVAGVSVYIKSAHEGWIVQPPCRISRYVVEKDKDREGSTDLALIAGNLNFPVLNDLFLAHR